MKCRYCKITPPGNHWDKDNWVAKHESLCPLKDENHPTANSAAPQPTAVPTPPPDYGVPSTPQLIWTWNRYRMVEVGWKMPDQDIIEDFNITSYKIIWEVLTNLDDSGEIIVSNKPPIDYARSGMLIGYSPYNFKIKAINPAGESEASNILVGIPYNVPDYPDGITGNFESDGNLRFSWKLVCLLYTSPSPRDRTRSRMPSSA